MILCPLCNSPMKERAGKRGKFYGCSRFPKCKGSRDFVTYPEQITLVPGSPEQEAFWNFLVNGTENGILQARAGTGKTFSIVNAVQRLRNVKVGIFSFNNHIIKEMNEKLSKEGITWARGHTYNAFGWKTIRNHPQFKNVELFNDKLPTLLLELVPDDDAAGNAIRYASERLVRLCKCYMEDGYDEQELSELIERFNIEINGDCDNYEELEKRTERIFQVVPRALELCLKRRATLDFDDQVWWTVKMNLPVERFDVVMIDEAQDTNKMQQELVKMVCP